MTNQEFEFMREAQKQQEKLAILRELDSLRVEIKEYISFKISTGSEAAGNIGEGILEIINEHIGEYE